MPVIAAPTAMPVKPGSEIGVSITRCSAEFLHQARQYFERRARFGHILADDEHARIATHFLGERLADRFGNR